MTSSHRRDFLRTFAAATSAGIASTVFPPSIRKALALGPKRCKGTIEDVEHIVILMQENRSFDHYFGTLSGVRGFGDRLPLPVRIRPASATPRCGISAGPTVARRWSRPSGSIPCSRSSSCASRARRTPGPIRRAHGATA